MLRRTLILLAAVMVAAVTATEADVPANRDLEATFDFFNIDVDFCDNQPEGENGPPQLGRCDVSRFPNCQDGKSQICYNRKPSRDHYHPGTHQPLYYIQYDRVFCFPDNWGGCSSCTPGRYCKSEELCILEEIIDGVEYPCAEWY